jgi:lysozyme
MKMSKAADIIKHFEGAELKAYQDTAGIWTIGYGHTKGVKPGDIITKEQASEYLEEDLKDAVKRVYSVVTVPLNDNELAALTSQAYNLRSFKTLASHLNKSRDLYKKKMLLYCYDVKKNKLNGLLIRRICERLLFEGREWLPVAKELQGKRDISYTTQKQKELFV